MPKYMTNHQVKITVGSTPYIGLINFYTKITRTENTFDVATLKFTDPKSRLRSLLVKGTAVQVDVKDQKDASWNTKFKGRIRFPTEALDQNGEVVVANCDGNGFGFADTVCAQEYGAQSSHPTLDTLKEILTDASYGIVPKYVNKILGTATDSGYAYDTSLVDVFADVLDYLYFPFKPNSKCLNDLIDLVQAAKGTNAGPHWIVTPDDYLLVTTVGNHSADAISKGWTTYVGGSTILDCLFKQGLDFVDFSFETPEEEANYILYYSAMKKPCDGDKWTENNSGLWSCGGGGTVSDEATIVKVGSYSLKFAPNNIAGDWIDYPSGLNASWDISKIGGKFNIPSLSFYVYNTTGSSIIVGLRSRVGGLSGEFLLSSVLSPPASTWKDYTIPLGPYARSSVDSLFWVPLTIGGPPSWDDIDSIYFWVYANTGALYVDGLRLDGWILRGAKDSTLIVANKLKMGVVNDPFGKSDSLLANDDSGTIAQLAKAELFRRRTTPMIGTFKSPAVKACFPGQLLHIHARPNTVGAWQIDKDFRVTSFVEEFTKDTASCAWTVTDDVKNARARAAFDSANELLKNIRPEFQDRQAAGTKMRDIDITLPVLEKDYPS